MDTNQQILDLVGDIYDASYQEALWENVLQGVAEVTGSTSAALVYQDETYPRASFVYAHGISHEAMHAYLSHYIYHDPFVDLIVKNLPRMHVSADHLLVESREKLRDLSTDFYDDFMIPNDMYHIGGAGLLVDDDRMAAIAIQRNESLGPWSEQQLKNLKVLTPHLQRAFRIHREFTRFRIQEYAIYSTLDQLLIGLVILDNKANIIYNNPAARMILKTHPAISIKNNKVHFSDFKHARNIDDYIRSVINQDYSTTIDNGYMAGLNHPDSDYPLLVMAKAVNNLENLYKIPVDTACVALFLSDSGNHTNIAPDALMETYGLTHAEAEVAVALANGMSLKDISNTKGTSLETVRTQLKSVFNKSNTSSQAELVRLLLAGVFSVIQ